MIPLGSLVRIVYIGVRYRLDTALAEFLEQHWLRWLLPSRYLPNPKTSSAERLRKALIRLGPIYVKFGQTLSTRRDLLPEDFANELEKLQDKVPPFDSELAIHQIESELGLPIHEIFSEFEKAPIASASLAQVHCAKLFDQSEVVVKVIRPDVELQIVRDLNMLKGVSRVLERVSSLARRLHLVDVILDYESTILSELDLEKEAANTIQLRTNFADSPLLYAPRVYTLLTTKNVLVMERIYGVPISAIAQLKELEVDFKLLARRGVETFFIQVFNHNFFHADMHPGNIFIDVSDPKTPSYIAVDCAIIGSLSLEDQTFVALNIVAFFNRDYAEIARLHVESGWVHDDHDLQAFETLIQELCEPFFQKPLAEISFGQFLLDLFTASRQFDMEVQPQLVLLQKTLLHIEGLGRQLDPELDLWSTAKPFMEGWMQQRYGALASVKSLLKYAPQLALELPSIPELLVSARRKIKHLDRKIEHQRNQLSQLKIVHDRARRARVFRRVFGCLLVGSSVPWLLVSDSLILPLVLANVGLILLLSQ